MSKQHKIYGKFIPTFPLSENGLKYDRNEIQAIKKLEFSYGEENGGLRVSEEPTYDRKNKFVKVHFHDVQRDTEGHGMNYYATNIFANIYKVKNNDTGLPGFMVYYDIEGDEMRNHQIAYGYLTLKEVITALELVKNNIPIYQGESEKEFLKDMFNESTNLRILGFNEFALNESRDSDFAYIEKWLKTTKGYYTFDEIEAELLKKVKNLTVGYTIKKNRFGFDTNFGWRGFAEILPMDQKAKFSTRNSKLALPAIWVEMHDNEDLQDEDYKRRNDLEDFNL